MSCLILFAKSCPSGHTRNLLKLLAEKFTNGKVKDERKSTFEPSGPCIHKETTTTTGLEGLSGSDILHTKIQI